MSLFKMDHSISKGDAVTGLGGAQLGVGPYDAAPPCRNSGSLAKLTAIRRASSRLSRVAAVRLPASVSK